MSTAKTVLLIDDDAEFTESNRALLEPEGYRVLSAHNGAEGLELAVNEQPDLLLLDVMMTTDTEGFDVSRKIADHPELKHMKVLMLTGIRREMNLPFSFEEDPEWLPVAGVLEKPIRPDELLAAVREQIG